VESKVKFTLHGLRASVLCEAKQKLCSCGVALYWSGDQEAIFRSSSRTAVTYELYQSFFAEVVESKSPSAYAFIKQRARLVAEDQKRMLLFDTFQESVWRAIEVLDMNYQNAFTCECCGTFETALIIIFDGKALVCQPGRTREPTAAETEWLANDGRLGSVFADRVFITDSKTRDILLRYTGRLKRSSSAKVKNRTPFTSGDIGTLNDLVDNNASFLKLWISELETNLANSNVRAHHLAFLAELSYNTSIDGGLFKRAADVRVVLQDLSTGAAVTPAQSQCLRDWFPALSRLLMRDVTLSQGLPDFLRPVILHLISVGNNLRNVPHAECKLQADDIWAAINSEDEIKSGYCYPNGHELRPSNSYVKATRLNDYQCREGACHKNKHKYQRVMPGVCAAFCPHGVNLGFHFMSNFESPETVFAAVFQRRRTAPRAIIYDHACGLHSYCMNREPWFFRNTEFFSDRFH